MGFLKKLIEKFKCDSDCHISINEDCEKFKDVKKSLDSGYTLTDKDIKRLFNIIHKKVKD